jgi:hypothetical protein
MKKRIHPSQQPTMVTWNIYIQGYLLMHASSFVFKIDYFENKKFLPGVWRAAELKGDYGRKIRGCPIWCQYNTVTGEGVETGV